MNILRATEYHNILAALRHAEQRSWILMNPGAIGETTMTCALASAFAKRHGHPITIVVPPDHLPIVQMYPNRFLRIVALERSTMTNITYSYLDSLRFELDVPICVHQYELGDCRIDDIQYLLKYPGRGGLTCTDIYRHILRLPWDASLERPQIPDQCVAEAQQFAANAGIVPGRSVILFPAANSNVQYAQLSDAMWKAAVDRLKENGYTVFCNMKGGNHRPATMPIAGTIPLEVPLHLALPLVTIAGRTITSSTGLQFLMLLGGQFSQMTVVAPIQSNFDDFSMNQRTYMPMSAFAQFVFPELCVDVPVSEFAVPVVGSEEAQIRAGIAIADNDQASIHYVRRMHNGIPYIQANDSWLRELITPLKA